ncbi:MAG: YceI family protein, partial [Melioribacteraceae bacterium]
GIGLRDKHLVSKDWLDAEKFPYAEFQLTAIKNSSSKSLETGKKVKATFVGKFSVHGVTKEVEAPGELTYFKESDKTKAKAPGNLLVARANFAVKLSDYGVTIPSMVVGKLSEDVDISVDFVASDANGGGNPCGTCNPCAAKKDNGKCNPCAMKDKNKKESPCAVKDNQCSPCAPKKK